MQKTEMALNPHTLMSTSLDEARECVVVNCNITYSEFSLIILTYLACVKYVA